MKKVKLLLCMLSLAGLGLLTACDDDDGGGSPDPGPGPDPDGTNAPAALSAGDSMQLTPADDGDPDTQEVPYTVTIDGETGYSTDFGETGTYTYASDGANGATLQLDPAASPDDPANDPAPLTYNLTFDSTSSGSYSINEIVEDGTFTFSDAPDAQ